MGALVAGIVLGTLGFSVMLGWWLDIRILKSVFPDLVTMKFNTGLCFLLAGTVLVLDALAADVVTRRLGTALALFVLVAGAATLLEYLVQGNFGIDELLVADPDALPPQAPGRMARSTTVSFMISGAVLAFLCTGPRRLQRPNVLRMPVLFVGIIGGLACAGYLLDFEQLYRWRYATPMALHTALGFTILAAGMWAAMARRLPPPPAADERRIVRVAAWCLILASTTAGLAAFATLQKIMQPAFGLGLETALRARGGGIAKDLAAATARSATIVSSADLLHAFALHRGDPARMRSRAKLQAFADGLVQGGFTSVTLESAAGDVLIHAGAQANLGDFTLALDPRGRRQLVWRGDMHLRTVHALADEDAPLGRVAIEQRLPEAGPLLLAGEKFGDSAEMLLCHPEAPVFRCFPSRMTPRPFTVDQRSEAGQFLRHHEAGDVLGSGVDYRGKRVLGAFMGLPGTGLIAVMKVDTSQIYAPVARQLPLAAVLIILLTGAGILAIHVLVRPLAGAFKTAERKYSTLLDSINDGVFVVQDGHFVYANDQLAHMLGYPHDGIVGLPFDRIIAPEDLAMFTDRVRRRVSATETQPESRYDLRFVTSDGTMPIWMELNARRTEFHGGPAVIGIVRDVTDRRRQHTQLQELALRDPLTGLYNRRYLEETLARELSRTARSGRPLSLAIIDIDHFKRLNDTHGHEAGDVMLKALADILVRHTRAEDVACRYGGEEFVLLFPTMNQEHARRRLEQIRTVFADLRLEHGGVTLQSTLSAGVATCGEAGTTGRQLIAAADEMLYEAKGAGRNRVMGRP